MYKYFKCSQQAMHFILFCILAKKETKRMYKGAFKQYQDLKNSLALSRAAQSEVFANFIQEYNNKRYLYSRMC